MLDEVKIDLWDIIRIKLSGSTFTCHKAFDRLWHQGLISKVKSYGVGNTFIRWPSDFLYTRSTHVVIDGISSISCIQLILE